MSITDQFLNRENQFMAAAVGVGTGTAYIATHKAVGDPDVFDQAGVVPAGVVVSLAAYAGTLLALSFVRNRFQQQVPQF